MHDDDEKISELKSRRFKFKLKNLTSVIVGVVANQLFSINRNQLANLYILNGVANELKPL